jgi:hypothetical protein
MSAILYIYYPLNRNAIICLKEDLTYFALILFFFFDNFGLTEENFETALQILKSIIWVVLKLMQNESKLRM